MNYLQSKRTIVTWINELNKFYGLRAVYQSNQNKPIKFFMRGNKVNAGADIPSKTIYIPLKYPALIDKRVVAHEYAHLIDNKPRFDCHDLRFEDIYKECCLALGVFYTPTKILYKELIPKLPEGSVTHYKFWFMGIEWGIN